MNHICIDFQFTPGHHCLYSSLYNIFRHMRLTLQEHEIFFLCNGLAFQIFAQYNETFFDIILDEIEIDYIKQIEVLTTQLNIKPIFFNNVDCVYDCLCKNRPVLAFIKAEALKYNIVDNPINNLGAHGLVIYGINLSKGYVNIADTYQIDYENNIHTFDTVLGLDDLLKYELGFCTFDITEHHLSQHIVDTACLKSIENFFSKDISSKFSNYDSIIYIIENLDHFNQDQKFIEKNQKNCITLIYLIKSYILNTLHYVEKQIITYSPEEQSEILTQVENIKKNFNAFFLRCLSNIGSTKKDSKIEKSGKIAVQMYKDLINKLYHKIKLLSR